MKSHPVAKLLGELFTVAATPRVSDAEVEDTLRRVREWIKSEDTYDYWVPRDITSAKRYGFLRVNLYTGKFDRIYGADRNFVIDENEYFRVRTLGEAQDLLTLFLNLQERDVADFNYIEPEWRAA